MLRLKYYKRPMVLVNERNGNMVAQLSCFAETDWKEVESMGALLEASPRLLEALRELVQGVRWAHREPEYIMGFGNAEDLVKELEQKVPKI